MIIKEKVWRVEGKIERCIIDVEEDNQTFGIYP
jgi:dTDP-4-dehydrorhamnose 3,5-epimerase-like enzyme